jgi:translation initiation factor IF-2
MSLDALFSEIESGNLKELDIIVKADVQGSVEAVKQSLEKLSNEEVVVKTIHGGVGTINESDVVLASASNAIIIGFNVRIDPQAKATADREGVDLRLYKVIYDAINDVESAIKFARRGYELDSKPQSVVTKYYKEQYWKAYTKNDSGAMNEIKSILKRLRDSAKLYSSGEYKNKSIDDILKDWIEEGND